MFCARIEHHLFTKDFRLIGKESLPTLGVLSCEISMIFIKASHSLANFSEEYRCSFKLGVYEDSILLTRYHNFQDSKIEAP